MTKSLKLLLKQSLTCTCGHVSRNFQESERHKKYSPAFCKPRKLTMSQERAFGWFKDNGGDGVWAKNIPEYDMKFGNKIVLCAGIKSFFQEKTWFALIDAGLIEQYNDDTRLRIKQ